VTKDDDVGVVAREQARRRQHPYFVAVADVHGQTADRLRKVDAQPGVVPQVGIAEHCLNRRDSRQHGQHVSAADIPGMEDGVHTLERVEDARADQAMGVRNEADDAGTCLPGHTESRSILHRRLQKREKPGLRRA
jgi:hypothetical protein